MRPSNFGSNDHQRQGKPNRKDQAPARQQAIDEAFVRFQRSGDPEDLAVVFDGTAPKLLQMSQHLAPEPGTADDLLQATFLAAIEHRHEYDAEKGSVRAWLFGILANRARIRRRAA